MHRRAGAREPGEEEVGQGLGADRDAVEDRGARVGTGVERRLLLLAQPQDQAGPAAGRGGQLGRTGGDAELVGVAGVDTRQQRGHQLFVDLVAQAASHEVADREVAVALGVAGGLVGRRLGGVDVGGGPGHALGADDARRGQGVHVGGHAQHQPTGEAAQLAAGPHQRRALGGGGEHPGDAELLAELAGLGHPGEEGVGAAVDRSSGERRGEDLAAHPVRRPPAP